MKRRGAAALLASALAVGCGGEGVDTGMMTPSDPLPATLTEIQETIFTPRCATFGCHGQPAPQQGMDLSEGRAHASIVGIPSAELPEFQRVAAGSAASSYVVLKLEGDPRIVGERMPLGGPYLTADEIARLRSWIAAGANDD